MLVTVRFFFFFVRREGSEVARLIARQGDRSIGATKTFAARLKFLRWRRRQLDERSSHSRNLSEPFDDDRRSFRFFFRFIFHVVFWSKFFLANLSAFAFLTCRTQYHRINTVLKWKKKEKKKEKRKQIEICRGNFVLHLDDNENKKARLPTQCRTETQWNASSIDLFFELIPLPCEEKLKSRRWNFRSLRNPIRR